METLIKDAASASSQKSIVWTATGGGNEATAMVTVDDTADALFTVALKAEASSELSKSGLRRVLLKVGTTIPGDQLATMLPTSAQGMYGQKNGVNLPISCHLVLTVPAAAFRADYDAYQGGGAIGQIAAICTRAIVALVGSGESLSGSIEKPTATLTYPLCRGLLGGEPLDPVNGYYGAAKKA